MKILTNKENNKIYPYDFEVRDKNILIMSGRVFNHSKYYTKKFGTTQSINFVFDRELDKDKYLKACKLVYKRFKKNGE